MPEAFRVDGDVAVGTNDELYLASPERKTLDYAFGKIQPDKKHVDRFSQNISKRRSFCDERGIKYVHFVAPDKHCVYKEGFSTATETDPVFSFAEHYMREGKTSFIYPVDYFRNLFPRRVYKRTDTHWTPYGTAMVCALIARELGLPEARVQEGLANSLASLSEEEVSISGDLGSKLTPPHTENVQIIKPTWREIRLDNNLKTGNDGIIKIVLSGNPNSRGKLLIFGDSYGNACLDFLGAYFREILFCRTRYFHNEIALSAKPDFIMTENVERYLALVTPDSEAPPMFMMAHLTDKQPQYDVKFATLLSYYLQPEARQFAKTISSEFGWSRDKGFS